MELKRLFQGSISLKDFHIKALRLVKEAENTQNRVLRDTIISGLASDRIFAKIIKEGKDVTFPSHGNCSLGSFHPKNILTGCRRQPRSTINSMGKGSKRGKPKFNGKGSTSGDSGGSSGKPSKPSVKG